MTCKSYIGRANINIYHGDCMEFMKDKPAKSYDLAICDPPYGIGLDVWDKEIPSNIYFDYLFDKTQEQFIFGGNYFQLPHTQGWICWDKSFNEYLRGKSLSKSKIKKENISEFELIWTSKLKKSKFIRFMNLGNLQGFDDNIKVDYTKQSKIHICEKPVQIYKLLLTNYAKAGDKILDTHGGSMSIAIACWDLGFDLDIIELDKDYYDKAVQRFERHINQKQIF